MDYEEKVEFLKSYQYLKNKIQSLIREREFYQNQRIKYAGSIIQQPSSQINKKGGISFVVATLDEIEYNLSNEIKRVTKELNNVFNTIEGVENTNYRSILMYRYVNDYTFEEIADRLPYNSKQYVCELHEKIINSMTMTNHDM